MKDTGTKMTTRLSVVARTACPMSAVAARAASNGDILFSSMNRNVFSSTTKASSITMPTINTNASIVTLFNVKCSAHITPNAEINDDGIATAAMTMARQLRMNKNTTRLARMLPTIKWTLIS